MNDFLERLLAALDRAEVEYMLAGSTASSFYAQPRTTQDFDVVVDLDPSNLDKLLEQFPEEHYYVSSEAARDAVFRRGMFNVVDHSSGFKADLIVLKNRPFSRSEFARRKSAVFAGRAAWFASPEDVILSKLEWARDWGGERQWSDVRSILQVCGEQLDWNYLRDWAAELQVLEDLIARSLLAIATSHRATPPKSTVR